MSDCDEEGIMAMASACVELRDCSITGNKGVPLPPPPPLPRGSWVAPIEINHMKLII